MSLIVFNAHDTINSILWDDIIANFPAHRRDIHFTSNYGRVQEKNGGEALLAVYDNHAGVVIVQPFIKRPTPYDPMLFDLCSPYGYGGPICNVDNPALTMPFGTGEDYDTCLRAWAKEENIVSEFCYLHPLFRQHQEQLVVADRQVTKNVVVIDLTTMSEQTISRRVRRGVRKAKAMGAIVVQIGKTDHARQQFSRLYEQSMDLKGAASRWRFSDDYLNAHYDELSAKLFYATNGVGERMLMMIGGYGTAYAHLLGSNGETAHSGLDDLLYCETARMLREQGYERFHLGGGTSRRDDDSLLTFKSGFSPDRWILAHYERVFNDAAYMELTQRKIDDELKQLGRISTSDRFPIYRREAA